MEDKELQITKKSKKKGLNLNSIILKIKKGLKNKEVVIFIITVLIIWIFIKFLPNIFEYLNK